MNYLGHPFLSALPPVLGSSLAFPSVLMWVRLLYNTLLSCIMKKYRCDQCYPMQQKSTQLGNTKQPRWLFKLCIILIVYYFCIKHLSAVAIHHQGKKPLGFLFFILAMLWSVACGLTNKRIGCSWHGLRNSSVKGEDYFFLPLNKVSYGESICNTILITDSRNSGLHMTWSLNLPHRYVNCAHVLTLWIHLCSFKYYIMLSSQKFIPFFKKILSSIMPVFVASCFSILFLMG